MIGFTVKMERMCATSTALSCSQSSCGMQTSWRNLGGDVTINGEVSSEKGTKSETLAGGRRRRVGMEDQFIVRPLLSPRVFILASSRIGHP
jgi:hypothetical protein